MQTTANLENVDKKNSLQTSLEKRQKEIRHKLSPPWWKRIWKRSDPELIKVLGQIHSGLSEISRLLVRRRGSNHWPYVAADIEPQLELMLKEDLTNFNINAAWEFSDSLRRMMLLLGDDSYIVAHLVNERAGSADENPHLKWEIFLERPLQKNGLDKVERKGELLEKLLSAYEEGKVDDSLRALTVEYLALIYSSRSRAGRMHRASIDLRGIYLINLYRTLFVLLLLLSLGTFFVSEQNYGLHRPDGLKDLLWNSPWNFLVEYFKNLHVRYFFIAAFAGAIGGVLSGFIKLRDQIKALSDLRSYRAAMQAQPFVGATIGALFYLLIASGVLGIDIKKADQTGLPSWSLLAIYCFFAGYSEPFFLRVVQRVAGTADKQSEAKTTAGTSSEKTQESAKKPTAMDIEKNQSTR